MTNAVCYDLYECSQIAEGKGGRGSAGENRHPPKMKLKKIVPGMLCLENKILQFNLNWVLVPQTSDVMDLCIECASQSRI